MEPPDHASHPSMVFDDPRAAVIASTSWDNPCLAATGHDLETVVPKAYLRGRPSFCAALQQDALHVAPSVSWCCPNASPHQIERDTMVSTTVVTI
eukprot:2828229-Amphidinium_carterae.1